MIIEDGQLELERGSQGDLGGRRDCACQVVEYIELELERPDSMA